MLTNEQITTNTLDDIIKQSNKIYKTFINEFAFEELSKITNQYHQLTNIAEIINQINQDIQEKQFKATQLFSQRLNKFKETLELVSKVSSNCESIISREQINAIIIPNKKRETVAPNIDIPAIRVNSIDDMPNNNLYFISELDQFAFKINGCIFRGNIGNIVTNSSYYKNGGGKKSKKSMIECRHGIKCDYLITNSCSFYHDPLDHDDFNHTILENRKARGLHHRNFLVQSWLYTPEPLSSKNIHMRHIGSRDELSSDIMLLNNAERRKRQDQTMHDILVSLAIDFYTKTYRLCQN